MTNTSGEVAPGAAAPAEQVIARLRPHARAMFWPCIALLAAAGGAGYYAGTLPQLWENVSVVAAAGLVALLLFLLPLGSWLSKHYTITSRRLIVRRGFFVRVRQELLHSRGYDVTVRRNWIQSVFRSGDIRINAGLDRPVVLRDVPHAGLVQSALQDLMENTRNVVSAHRQFDESVPGETRVWGAR